jgi:Bacterial Ig domain/Purple acid Phosphatase, N-terminal domain
MGGWIRAHIAHGCASVVAASVVLIALFGVDLTSQAATAPCAPSGLRILESAPTPDTRPPTVYLTAPAAAATVSGTAVVVSACAADNVAVAGVQFTVDGANIGVESTARPYSVTWNTTTAAIGSHTLRAVARDAAGNVATSAGVAVTVSNDTTPPVFTVIAASSITTTGATITWTTNEASDSQVNYGTTTAYGSTTSLNASPLTAHVVVLTGLSASTVYHFRVRSRDAAGNLGLSGDSTFTTAAVVTTGWPHQPAGMRTLTDWAMDALIGGGWNIVNGNGYATVTADATATMSAPNVGRWRYPAGFAGGSAPATMYYPLPSAFNEGFVGITWNPSNPWQGHSSFVNKIFFLLGGNCGNLIPIMYGPNGGPYQLRVAPEWGNWSWLTPNVNDIPVALGAWHKIELYFKYNSGSPNGIVRWWMDGTLIGDYTNISFPASGCFSEFQFSPTWGGVGDTKSQTDYFLFDHAFISVPSGAPPPSDTTPPTVSITAPAGGATVSGTAVPVPATAADNVGVAGVQFALDGSNLGGEDTSAPYSLSWNTTTASNGSHTLTAVARDAAGNRTTSSGVGVTVSNANPPPPVGTVLFQESFDNSNVASRGWYDNTAVLLSATEHVANSTSSIQYTFPQGAMTPTAGSALRRKFTPTDSVYLGYWVKYSTNWVGSQRPYHPHEFHFLTTRDGDWSGLSFNYLTTYIEQNGGTPLLAIQDGSNVDQTKIGVNLTAITENRSVAGCNGSSDGYPDNCYSNGTAFVNEKKWRAAQQYFTDSAGAFYKNDWHYIEAFIKLNSIAGGKGVNDGVVQYWFDGQLIIDKHDVLLRTAANASMLFNQLIIAPYIGDGSPVSQSMWIDNVTVATGKP